MKLWFGLDVIKIENGEHVAELKKLRPSLVQIAAATDKAKLNYENVGKLLYILAARNYSHACFVTGVEYGLLMRAGK